MVNGDCVLRVDPQTLLLDGDTVVRGDVLEFIPEGKYEDIYTGNIKDFLLSFNGEEENLGFIRVDSYYETGDIIENEEKFAFLY